VLTPSETSQLATTISSGIPNMIAHHKNKTFATFLAAIFGGMGLHRFYLHGKKDRAGWLHFAAIPLSLIGVLFKPEQPLIFTAMPLMVSALAGLIAALAIGLTPDEKWDVEHNSNSGRQSNSGWLLILLLVATFGAGTTALIAAIARTFDLLFTGGAYG
jgi:TM2 domain-containing membrane protein YozV